ncbi:MAG: hypothetical protein AB1896_07230 [Thermodesulfobacteriota bacterium]
MALTADKKTEYREGVDLAVPVGAGEVLYNGALVCVGTDGYAVPGDDAANLQFEGVARSAADNAAGLDGAESVMVRRRGLFKMTFTSAIAQSDVGGHVYIVDDETVGLAADVTHAVYCGVIAEYIDSTHAWVDIEPAVKSSDVTDHIADPSAAHAASAVSIADAGGFTSATQVEAALQELYQDALSAAHVIPVPLGAFTQEDGTALTKFTAGATPGFQQLSNKEVVLAWDGNATPGAAAVMIPFVDPAIDDGADVVVHALAKMSGATDTPVLAFEAYFGSGDTDCAGTDPEITGGTTLTEYTMTIAAADVPAAPSALTLVLTPTAGEMGTDELHLYGLWLEVTRKPRTA